MPLHEQYPPLLGYHPILASILIGLLIAGTIIEIWWNRNV